MGTATQRQHVDELRRQQHRHGDDRQRHGGDAHRKQFSRRHRRRHDQVEIGARIERPCHRLHRLRHHQRPRQQRAAADRNECRLVEIAAGIGERPHHGEGDEMQEGAEQHQHDGDAACAPAPPRRHHAEPVAPGEPQLVRGEPGDGAGRAHAPRSKRCAVMSRTLVGMPHTPVVMPRESGASSTPCRCGSGTALIPRRP